MKVFAMLMIAAGLSGAIFLGGTRTAQALVICNARLGSCTTGFVSRRPVAGRHCRLLSFASSKYRGRYFCS